MVMDAHQKLIILGHTAGGVEIVVDLAYEQFGIRAFDIVKNASHPELPFNPTYAELRYFNDADYPFTNNATLGVHFGVHGPRPKKLLYEHFEQLIKIQRARFVNIWHASSYIAPSVELNHGLLLEPLALISSCSKIGFGVSIKRSASVGHHAELGDFVNINPGAVLSGFVQVGEGAEIGTGACVSNNISIGKHSLIGAGSVVTRNIPDGVIAYGNPCKPVRDNEAWR
jgi:sugar O-acyltransferase (sialic acid O-acetyltransferase NeuD family)